MKSSAVITILLLAGCGAAGQQHTSTGAPATPSPTAHTQPGLVGIRGWVVGGASVDGVGMGGGRLSLDVRPSSELRIEAGAFYYGRAWSLPSEADVRGDAQFNSTFGFAASASMLFFEPVRIGPYLDIGIGGGSSGAYLFPTFGLEAETEIRLGGTERIAFAGRIFVQPWVPLSQASAAPAMFGAGFAFAFDALPVPTNDSPDPESLAERVRFFSRSELDDVHGDAASEGCDVSIGSEWHEVPAGTATAPCGTATLEPHGCGAWLAVADSTVDIDLRGFAGATWGESELRSIDAAGDAWPVVVICNPNAERAAIRIEGMRYDRNTLVGARVAHWEFALPREAGSDVVALQTDFAAIAPGHRRCLLTQLHESGAEQLITLPDGVYEVQVWAPAVSEIEATAIGGRDGLMHAESLSWSEPHVVGFDSNAQPRRVRVHSGGQGIGGPVLLCADRAGAADASADTGVADAGPPSGSTPDTGTGADAGVATP